ncbi:calmodulin-binding-domain-containing protein, partial [Entophlyctis helioformis]
MATGVAPTHPFPGGRATAARARGPPVDPRSQVIPVPSDAHEENVYRLIPEEYVAPAKEQRYRSQFAEQVRQEYKSDCKPAASMGPAKVVVNHPSEFVKRGDREKIGKPVPKGQPDRTVRKAPVPKELGEEFQPSQKDFIKQNALDNINSAPKKTAGKSPSYLAKKDYGRTPDYLKRRISELKETEYRRAQDLAEQERTKSAREGIVPLPDEERARILDGLKANWEKLNSDYQKLSLTVDTVPKIARKVNMEQQLKQYEELIEKFSHTNIHVNF